MGAIEPNEPYGFRAEYRDFYIRQLTTADVGSRYLSWVHDKEVTAFLEIRNNSFSEKDLIEYVRVSTDATNKLLFGLFVKDSDEHIGNATIYDINYEHGFFNIGYFIGEKSYWGGYAGTALVLMLLEIAFDTLKLRKFFGQGVYSNNIRSRFVLKKIGCVEEAFLREKYLYDGKYVDQVIYTMDRERWDGAKRIFFRDK